ncbi:MAG TPA: hypothetical protein EYO40_08855 [Phycisphaerales bacterium]|nr:hypothetical protein [Phycisphaerales bacterium]
MDRTDIYLQLVMENPLLMAPVVLFIFAFAIIPSDKRFFLMLVILVPWLTIGRSGGLGPIAAAAKLSSGGAYLLIALSAFLHPGPKREIPYVVWMFVIIACVSILYVVTTQERMLALVLRSQWICVTLAGVLTARTIVRFGDLKRVVNAMTLGCLIALIIPISGWILFPSESFLRGMGRFQPWGVNSNQIGMLFALAAPLFAYAAMTHKNVSLKPFFLFALIITIGMALMTASRQTMLAVILVMLPVMLVLTKRPVMTVLGLGVAAIALPFILSLGAEADLQRYSSLETGRLDIWGAYFTEVFPKRPLFGLLGTSGQSYFKAINEVGQHPHNAWLYLMYIGGLSFAVPMIYLTVYSTYSGWMVWKYRNVLPGDPFLYSILIMILVAMYIQGLFNQVVYWPTYAWSFLHVVFASLFICMWRDIRDGNVQGALFEDYDPYSDEVEDDTEEFEEYQDYGRVVQRPTS